MALSIKTQPTANEIVYARSPIVYRFEGCDPASEYKFSLYCSTSYSPNIIYTTVDRQIDLTLGITVDVSNMVKNYLRNNLDFENNNLIYFKGYIEGFNSEGTSTGSITTDVAKATLGYVDDDDVYLLQGTNVGFNIGRTGNFMMQNNIPDEKYSIPNYGATPYYLTYKAQTATHYTITFYKIGVGEIPFTWYFTTGINQIKCSYYDITDYYGYQDVDTSKNIKVEVFSNLTLLGTYYLTPEPCKYNDLYQIKFMNKYGVWELFYMDGKNEEEIDIEFDIYKNNNVNSATMTYDYRFGSYHKYNVVGKTKLMLNTGWIDDIKNDKIKDIMLSEYVYVNSQPYIITDKNVKYKSNKYDKIVNYTFTFEKSHDIINNII